MQKRIIIETPKSSLYVVDNFTDDLLSELQTKVCPLLEHEPPIMVYGKMCKQRRDVGFFSDTSIGYEYSNQIMSSQPLSTIKVLSDVLDKVNRELDTNFNGILVNRYSNGENVIGAHSDSEKGLDKKKGTVVALSYGAVRKFRIRDVETKNIVVDIPTTHRSMIVMEGEFQKEFTHEIPQEKKVKDERISLTFRHHVK